MGVLIPTCWGTVVCDQGASTLGLFVFFLNFWPHRAACGILVPRSGIEPLSPALGVQSLNHWTAREEGPALWIGEHVRKLQQYCQQLLHPTSWPSGRTLPPALIFSILPELPMAGTPPKASIWVFGFVGICF